MIECPNCGDNLKFDIATQDMGCPSCASHFDPYQFDDMQKDGTEETMYKGDYEVTVFTCPQCGGELLSTDHAAAAFCNFCGASTILFSRMQKEHRPAYIIPFRVTKEDCKTSYAKLMKKAIFAPRTLRSAKNIDSFRGIYMPYWAFHISQKGPVYVEGTKNYRQGDYIITDHYRLGVDLDAYYKGLSYDASSSFADSISETIAPYDVKGMKNFTPGYLSGFYADTADVAPGVYEPVAEHVSLSETTKVIKRQYSTFEINESEVTRQRLGQQVEAADLSMFPVWFMTHRNKDRVTYATVNGQTGKASVDIPIDKGKYLLFSLLLSIPIILLLLILPTFTVKGMLFFVGVLGIAASIFSVVLIKKIGKKETGEEDRGVLALKDPGKLREMNANLYKEGAKQKVLKSKTKFKDAITTIMMIVICACSGGSIFLSAFAWLFRSIQGALGWLILIAAMLGVFIFGIAGMSKLPKKRGLVGLFMLLGGVSLTGVLVMMNFASDYIYYGCAFFLMASTFVTLTGVIDLHNLLSTRPLPQFEKKGGDDNA